MLLFLDIVILDWGELADGNYLLDAVPNALKVNIIARAVFTVIAYAIAIAAGKCSRRHCT